MNMVVSIIAAISDCGLLFSTVVSHDYIAIFNHHQPSLIIIDSD